MNVSYNPGFSIFLEDSPKSRCLADYFIFLINNNCKHG